MRDGSDLFDSTVCVVIAAFNASATVDRAIASALKQAEVTEIVVVDDCSTDETVSVARACDDGTGRLKVLRLDRNVGPSAARNLAIASSTAQFIAILDSDDFFLPGRFADLLAWPDWDMIADNIVFIAADAVHKIDADTIASHQIAQRTLDAASFVEGCITRPDRYKGELGFLKPVVSRAFFHRHALRYSEEMRLSEDYDLYVRALIRGARFRIVDRCYYVAVERSRSLSTDHSVSDLAAIETADRRLLAAAAGQSPQLRKALRQHRRQAERKWRHRAILHRKREVGTAQALRELAGNPSALSRIIADVLRDKLPSWTAAAVSNTTNREVRFLLE